MRDQRVLSPGSSLESWTVLGAGDLPAAAIEAYLAYLTDIERSPNTVKAYADDLKDYVTFLDGCGLDWREVRLEDIGEFVAWLRLPPAGRDGRVAILPSGEHHVSASTVNRKLSALSAFYLHAARNGADLGELPITWGPAGRRGGWKPFLHHISHGAGQRLHFKGRSALPRSPAPLANSSPTSISATAPTCTTSPPGTASPPSPTPAGRPMPRR
jgi:integrase/recombinase XerD